MPGLRTLWQSEEQKGKELCTLLAQQVRKVHQETVSESRGVLNLLGEFVGGWGGGWVAIDACRCDITRGL